MIGESPTRPGIFHASPEVVVVPDISPFSFTARQLMVPVGGCLITLSIHGRSARSSGLSKSPARSFLKSGLSSPGRQSFDDDAFQPSHALRESSVRRFIVSKP